MRWSRKIIWIVLLLLPSLTGFCQQKAGTVDVFMGVDFNYRDIFWNGRVYDLLINLTPGFKWNMGKRWEMAAHTSRKTICDVFPKRFVAFCFLLTQNKL